MGKTIVLTGGGTAGHVTPNLALLPGLRERGFDIHYIGSYNGIEKDLMAKAGVDYTGISTGKLRRYLSKENIKDIGNVMRGISEARKVIRELQPDIVFSKGGYVSVPVVRAAAMRHIPVIIHESDMTPGLANKLCYSAAAKICCNFPETLKLLPKDKAVLSGSPIREELLSGTREAGLAFTGLSGEKPVLLMIGGSSGARNLNERLRSSLDTLLKTFDVVHLCGKGNLDEAIRRPGYLQYEYISDELKDLFAMADVVFSRAGANAICELLALRKPALLVPLSKATSRGDQILNARSFEAQGFSMVIEEEELTDDSLIRGILSLYENREQYISKMAESAQANGVNVILGLIDELTAK